MRIESAAGSHRGHVRPDNEDRCLELPQAGLWAVADGMGGHEGGEWAADAVVEELERSAASGASPATAIQSANRSIMAESRRRGRAMGSTVVALHARTADVSIAWVGDSRAYRLRDGRLERLTHDHSRVQELVDAGLLHPDDARGHPMSHILARAVGASPAVEVSTRAEPLLAGDVFLLCSDGLSGPVEESSIAAALALRPLTHARDRLIALALARGAPDNVTVVLVSAEAD